MDRFALCEALGQLGVVDLHDDGLVAQHDLVLHFGTVVSGPGDTAGQGALFLREENRLRTNRQAAGAVLLDALHLAGGGDGEGVAACWAAHRSLWACPAGR